MDRRSAWLSWAEPTCSCNDAAVITPFRQAKMMFVSLCGSTDSGMELQKVSQEIKSITFKGTCHGLCRWGHANNNSNLGNTPILIISSAPI